MATSKTSTKFNLYNSSSHPRHRIRKKIRSLAAIIIISIVRWVGQIQIIRHFLEDRLVVPVPNIRSKGLVRTSIIRWVSGTWLRLIRSLVRTPPAWLYHPEPKTKQALDVLSINVVAYEMWAQATIQERVITVDSPAVLEVVEPSLLFNRPCLVVLQGLQPQIREEALDSIIRDSIVGLRVRIGSKILVSTWTRPHPNRTQVASLPPNTPCKTWLPGPTP